MPLPIAVSETAKSTLQNQVFEQIRSMIVNGQLKAGDPLPGTRELSMQMGISRNTAVLAYERLISEGYIHTKPQVGTFVSETLYEKVVSASANGDAETPAANGKVSDPPPPARSRQFLQTHSLRNPHTDRLTADFWIGRPDPASFPVKVWSRHIWRQLQRSHASLTEYNDPQGLEKLRVAISDHLGPARGIVVDADRIVIVSGCQDAFNLVARLLVETGTPLVIENPCYQGAAYVFESFGAEPHPVPVDECGLDVSRLPDVSRAVAYLTPSHQYPMGATLSLPRRLELLAWADRCDAYIVEDDYDSDFRFNGAPLTAVKGLDRSDRVIYTGTFSKCMGPGLRLGYVVLPKTLVDPARRLKALMNNGQSWLEQSVMADFMLDGGFRRHLRRMRRTYLARRDALLAALETNFGKCHVRGADAGMHLIWRIPPGLPEAEEIEKRALKAGVGVYAMSTGSARQFGSLEESRRYLVLGYAAMTPKQIDHGISRLAKALSREPCRSAAAAPGVQRRTSP